MQLPVPPLARTRTLKLEFLTRTMCFVYQMMMNLWWFLSQSRPEVVEVEVVEQQQERQ